MFYGGLLWLFHCSDNINEPNQVATCRPKRLHWCWIILFAQSFNHYYLVFKHWRIYLSTFHGLQDFLDTGWWRQELWCRAISCLTQQSETYQENRPISFAGCTWKKLIKAMCIIFFPCHFKNENKKSHTSACCTGTFDPKKNSLSLFSVFSQRFISDFDTPRHTECIQSTTKPFTKSNGLKSRNTDAPFIPFTCMITNTKTKCIKSPLKDNNSLN